jgi:hypothetical protein
MRMMKCLVVLKEYNVLSSNEFGDVLHGCVLALLGKTVVSDQMIFEKHCSIYFRIKISYMVNFIICSLVFAKLQLL